MSRYYTIDRWRTVVGFVFRFLFAVVVTLVVEVGWRQVRALCGGLLTTGTGSSSGLAVVVDFHVWKVALITR